MFCWAVWITWFASSSRSIFEKVKREQIKWKMIIFFIFFGVLLTVSVFQISFQSLIKWQILVAQNSNPQSTFFELNCLVKRWTKETKMLLVCREASVSGTAN
jgi:nitrogen fixation protein FixH